MASASSDEADEFARTFAPDRDRPAAPRPDFTWLLGVVLVLAAAAILVTAWFAFQRTLPASGPFAMRPSPGRTIEELRNRNKQAAPFAAVSSLPLLGAGVWMLATRPPRNLARGVVIVAAATFAIILAASSVAL